MTFTLARDNTGIPVAGYDDVHDLIKLSQGNAAALGDSMANPTATLVGAMNAVWDGFTWRRLATAGTMDSGSYNLPPGFTPMYWDSASSTYMAASAGGLADANTGTRIPGAGLFGLNPSNGWDKLRTLGASGYQLGVQLTAGASHAVSQAFTASQVNANTYMTGLAATDEHAVVWRTILFSNADSAQSAAICFGFGLGTAIGGVDALTVVLPPSCSGVISPDGLVPFGGAPYILGGDPVMLRYRAAQAWLHVYKAGANLTAGVNIDYLGATA